MNGSMLRSVNVLIYCLSPTICAKHSTLAHQRSTLTRRRLGRQNPGQDFRQMLPSFFSRSANDSSSCNATAKVVNYKTGTGGSTIGEIWETSLFNSIWKWDAYHRYSCYSCSNSSCLKFIQSWTNAISKQLCVKQTTSDLFLFYFISLVSVISVLTM